MKSRINSLIIAFILYVISLSLGMIGYTSIENYTPIDAFYMTVMTLSTVGFGEIKELSDAGKVFTSIFILYNLCILAYVVSVISRYLFEGELKEIFNSFMSNREISKLDGHVIVCGFGRNGQRACQELEKDGYQYVVIDPSEEHMKNTIGDNQVNYIIGDATNEEILNKAGINKAYALITAVPKDTINVFVTLSARELNKELYIIARATNDSSISKLKTAGANKVVLPDAIGGRYMADLVSKPQVLDFLDIISGADGHLSLVKVLVKNFKPEFKNKTIVELQTRANSGVNILGYKDSEGQEYIFNPPASQVLTNTGILMVLGNEEDIEQFKNKYTIK